MGMSQQVNLLLGKGEQTPKWDFRTVGGPFNEKGDILSEGEAYSKLQNSEHANDQSLLEKIEDKMTENVAEGNPSYLDKGGSVRIFCYRQQDYGSSLDSYDINDIINAARNKANIQNPTGNTGITEDYSG